MTQFSTVVVRGCQPRNWVNSVKYILSFILSKVLSIVQKNNLLIVCIKHKVCQRWGLEDGGQDDTPELPMLPTQQSAPPPGQRSRCSCRSRRRPLPVGPIAGAHCCVVDRPADGPPWLTDREHDALKEASLLLYLGLPLPLQLPGQRSRRSCRCCRRSR